MRTRGFTIPELLIVMFILTALIAGAIIGLNSIKARGQVTRTMKDVSSISTAMTAFNSDIGFWPRDKDGILDLFKGTNLSTNYSGVEASLWRGPYVQMNLNAAGYPINPFGGVYYTRYTCSSTSCEYGVVITNVPVQRAIDLDSKIDGAIDKAHGNCIYQDASIDSYAAPASGRTNVYVRVGIE